MEDNFEVWHFYEVGCWLIYFTAEKKKLKKKKKKQSLEGKFSMNFFLLEQFPSV